MYWKGDKVWCVSSNCIRREKTNLRLMKPTNVILTNGNSGKCVANLTGRTRIEFVWNSLLCAPYSSVFFVFFSTLNSDSLSFSNNYQTFSKYESTIFGTNSVLIEYAMHLKVHWKYWIMMLWIYVSKGTIKWMLESFCKSIISNLRYNIRNLK